MLVLFSVIVALACVHESSAGSNWCCKSPFNPISIKYRTVTKSKSIVQYKAQMVKSIIGYEYCKDSASADANSHFNGGADDDSVAAAIQDALKNNGTIGNNQTVAAALADAGVTGRPPGSGSIWDLGSSFKKQCPVYSTKSFAKADVATVYFNSPVSIDDTCADKDLVCCNGYVLVGDNCQDENTAADSKDTLDFLASLGAIGK